MYHNLDLFCLKVNTIVVQRGCFLCIFILSYYLQQMIGK